MAADVSEIAANSTNLLYRQVQTMMYEFPCTLYGLIGPKRSIAMTSKGPLAISIGFNGGLVIRFLLEAQVKHDSQYLKMSCRIEGQKNCF